jgi:hypothetical protein
MDYYSDEVKKHIYEVKSRLPADFPLQTRIIEDDVFFIVICIPMKDFVWRTVEDRLHIALEIEKLRTLIQETGITCVIEKD